MTFDDRTEKNIATLIPKAQEKAREFMAALKAAGINAKIISGTRNYDEQDALYAQGRTAPGRKVTNAKGGYSNHNFGIAWDIGIFSESNGYLEESPLYDKAGSIGHAIGLEWGGAWSTFQDKPHFQLKTGLTLGQMRQRVADGQEIV